MALNAISNMRHGRFVTRLGRPVFRSQRPLTFWLGVIVSLVAAVVLFGLGVRILAGG
jgi:hypothetical protein